MSVAGTWGTTATERELVFPCDSTLKGPAASFFRGVTIVANNSVIFRWLCQMRVASYSYGWRSPHVLIPGVDELEPGQRFMDDFELVEFERDRHLTIRLTRGALSIFGDFAVSYLIVASADDTCRLLMKIVVRSPGGPFGWLIRTFAPWADLAMSRRQLLNFKRLAEQTSVTR